MESIESTKPNIPSNLGNANKDNIAALHAALADCDPHFVMLNTTQAASITGLTKRGMEALRQKGGGPLFIKVGAKCVRYRLSDLVFWIDSHAHHSTAEV
jgi:hypothetical protein